MISEVVMPQMGADMAEGTIVRWLKHEGDAVERGEIIAEIETDKANVEIEAFEGGTFRATLAAEGDVIPVGDIIAVIGDADDDISGYTSTRGSSIKKATASASTQNATPAGPAPAIVPNQGPSPAPATPPRPARTDKPSDLSPPSQAGSPRIRVSPVARNLAREHNVDLSNVPGTGPDGRIVRRDVEAVISALPQGTQTQATGDRQPAAPSKMRQAIARRMSQSKREAPHYYLLIDIDMTDAAEFRRQFNDTLGDDARVSINDLIVRASALALQHHPEFNATIAADQVTPQGSQHICIGIALDDGLIAPAILDAGTKTLAQIAADARDLTERARTGSLRPRELTDGTFTISNLGAFGVETLIAIIQPPQTAILGVGTVAPQPAVRDGSVVVRQIMQVALSADHRVTDGAQGARFLAEIKRLLEHPLLLVL